MRHDALRDQQLRQGSRLRERLSREFHRIGQDGKESSQWIICHSISLIQQVRNWPEVIRLLSRDKDYLPWCLANSSGVNLPALT